jgi:long-chain acyl-CoA synthetase
MDIITLLKNNADRYPKKCALIEAEEENTVSYEVLYQQVVQYALFLRAHGIEAGQKAAIFMPNSYAYIVALFALFYLNAIPVLIDHRFSIREVKECLHVTATGIIFSSEHQQNICQDLHEQGFLKQIFIFSKETLAPPIITCTLTPIKEKASSPAMIIEETMTAEQAAGATGTRKLILFTYRGNGYILPVLLNEQAIMANVASNNVLTRINEQTVISLMLPLSHIFALSCNCLSPLSVGATLVIINSLAPPDILAAFEHYKLNLLAAVPSQIYILLHCLEKRHFNLSALKQGVIGGDSLSKEMFQSWKELTGGSILVQGYGLTETCAVICNRWYDHQPESLGKVMQGVKAQVRDEKGKKVPINKPGNLWLKSNTLMEGYLNQPALNQQVIQAGWFDTGDLVYEDKNGYFYFIKRIKPIAKIGATTVDIREVKEVISQIPGVKEVQIALGNDPLWQEKLICTIKATSPLTSTDIKIYCKSTQKVIRVICSSNFYQIYLIETSIKCNLNRKTIITNL